MINYQGLPIKKYHTVGTYALNFFTYGDPEAQTLNRIHVVCMLEDITTSYTQVSLTEVKFVHDGKIILCHLVNNFPTLQKYLEDCSEMNMELVYLIEFGKFLFPMTSWLARHALMDKVRKRFMFTENMRGNMEAYAKELLRSKKGIYKKVVRNKFSIDRDTIIRIHHSEEDGWLTKPGEIDRWRTASYPEQLEWVAHVAHLQALYRYIAPAVFDGRKHYHGKAALRMATIRMCTVDAPIEVRVFCVNNFKNIMSTYSKNYVSNFIKQYIEYDNSNKESEKETNVVSTT